MLKATITLEAKTWGEIKDIGEEALRLLGSGYRSVRNDNGLRSFQFDVTGEEENIAGPLSPLFRASFIRGEKTFQVVFRIQDQEAAIPYLEQNFGIKIWNIEIQPIADPTPYVDLKIGEIRDESTIDDE